METFGDKVRAFFFALIVHVLCIGALFAGLLWTQAEVHPLSLPGPVVDVELTGISQAPKPPTRPKQAPKTAPPKTQPEAVKPPEPTPQSPTQVEQQDRVDRERVVQIAEQKAEAERAEEERHRQEQVQLEQEKKREQDIQKQLEKVRKEREQADKNLKLQKEKLAQLQDLQKQQTKPVKAQPQPVPENQTAQSGNEGKDDSLQAQYFAAIQSAITNNWLRPDSTQPGLRCTIRIVQIPGGDVIGVQLSNPCNADPQTRTSIEQAVKRASPLPFKGFEKVFSRDFNLNFTYDG